MNEFTNQAGIKIVTEIIKVIQLNKQYLSDIDGLIGDGDHGVNMNKGFTLCEKELEVKPGDMSHGFNTLSKILMTKIGGSMGPLYGIFFRSLAKESEGVNDISAAIVRSMFNETITKLSAISTAKQGDKTLMDALIPAVDALNTSLDNNNELIEALANMKAAAEKGRDSTYDMIARLGRSARLGERSKGVLDAGATSCALIVGAFSDSATELMQRNPVSHSVTKII
jgi:phosphoenolpyruvate---glycerone phosphotransferase subunit DhaL